MPKQPDRFTQPEEAMVVVRRPVPMFDLGKFDPNQERAPAGTSEGGQWTDGGGGSPKAFTDRKSADEWGASTQKWAAGLTQQEQDALDRYTYTVGLNETLRAGKEPGTDEIARYYDVPGDYNSPYRSINEAQQLTGMDSIFAKPEAVLQEDVITHRAWAGRGTPRGKEGSTFTDKGFTSTALDRNEIDVFRSDPNTGKVRGIDVEVTVRRGTRAIFVGTKPEGADWYADSTELLINRGTRYRVTRVDETGPRKKLYLETIP